MNEPKEFRPKDMSKVRIDAWTPARVALLIECNRHPVLIAQLVEANTTEWAEQLAEIAAYCNVIMDGLYSDEDLEILYPQLTKRMVDTRLGASSGIVLSTDVVAAKKDMN